MNSGYQAIILAAGKGVRMRSETPKVLHKVCGRTLVHRALAAASGLKPQKIVVVVGYRHDAVETEIEQLRSRTEFQGIELKPVLQAEQNGTGHAAQMTLPYLTATAEVVVILPGDSPLIETEHLTKLAQEFEQAGATLGVLTCKHPQPFGFGRILRTEDGSVQGIVEEKDCTAAERQITEINSSVYICRQSFLCEALGSLKNNNAQKEYYLTDIVSYAVQKSERVIAVQVSDYVSLLGANSRAELSELETIRRRRINRSWMEKGVTLENPEAIYIDEDVVIGEDCFLGAGTRLRGHAVLERRVVVDGDSLIENSSIGADSHVKFSCVITDSDVGAGADLGPFAHLRPGTKLHEDVKIGNFVETKKTELRKGAKANHLTYLGDADVGEKANVGAGTITCNYDGTHKYKTEIGKGAFIGSNSCLVAPVKIGEGAYIGAGSTITNEVPAKALGIGRAKQRNIEGWVARKKGE